MFPSIHDPDVIRMEAQRLAPAADYAEDDGLCVTCHEREPRDGTDTCAECQSELATVAAERWADYARENAA